MFSIRNYISIINHLKNISPGSYKENQKEIVIHCPYCDDSQRLNAKSHGHLYLSKDAPVFNCFRCNSSGNLIRLLVDTGFDDDEILKNIRTFIKYSEGQKDVFTFKKPKTRKVHQDFATSLIKFEQQYPNQYQLFQRYIKYRIGDVEFGNFLIMPSLNNEDVIIKFYNYDSSYSVSRFFDKRRYFNRKTIYMFQENSFSENKKIVFCEGPFDIINLYLYSYQFKDSLFISLNGKSYSRVIETFLIENMLIGNYQINLVFDNDNRNKKINHFSCKKLCNTYNENIEIKSWIPVFKNDVGEIPIIMELG